MKLQDTTKANTNKLLAFRQAVYANVLLARKNALFDLLDVLIAKGAVRSTPRFPVVEMSSVAAGTI